MSSAQLKRRESGMGRRLVALAGTCGLAAMVAMVPGCTVGPDYEAPGLDGPAAFTHTGAEGFNRVSSTTDAVGVEVAWWSTLRDPALDGLIGRAVRSNLDLRLAAQRIAEARAQRGVVASEDKPDINVGSGFTRRRNSERVQQFPGSPIRNTWEFGFDSTWELDVWGRVARGVEAADADIAALIENRRDVMITLLSDVARNYVELRGFQQRLAIARKNIALQEDTLELTQARFNAGLTNEVDVSQARSVLATTQAAVPSLDDGVQRSIHRLGVLLGMQPTALLQELASAEAIPAVPDVVGVGLPSQMLRRRADIRRAERELAAATARVGVATADLFPRFSLTGAFGYQSNAFDDIGDESARFWSFGPAVRWPIFQWGRVRAAIGVENARVDQALTRYEQAVLVSFEEVENALSAFTREQSRRMALVQAVEADRRAFDLSNQLYANGLTDFLRVLDSQRALFTSEDALVQSDQAVTANLIALYKALGGGWEAGEAMEANQPVAAQPEPGAANKPG